MQRRPLDRAPSCYLPWSRDFHATENNNIMCIDLMNGATHWEMVRDARYVAGVHNNQVIMVSNTDVHALNLTDAWPVGAPMYWSRLNCPTRMIVG